MAKKYLMINGKLILLNDKLIEIPDTATQELVDANYTLVNQNKELVKEIENLLSSRVIGGIEKISASDVQIGEGDFDVVSFDGTYNNKTIEVSGDNNTIYVYDINTVVLDAGESAVNGQAINLIRSSGNVSANNLTPENIKKDVSILGVTGTYDNGVEGVEMNVNGLYINNVNNMTPVYINSDVGRIELNSFVDGYLNIGSSANVDIRYEEGATITSPNLNAENIKKDVNILGVKGTFEGGSSENTLKKLLDATKSCCYLFANYPSNTVYYIIQYNDTENVTDMQTMFDGSNIQDMPLLNTSKVTSMNSMFYNCRYLTNIALLDTGNVTSMNYMFYGCRELQTIPQFNTSKVTSMAYMFYGCNNLTNIPLLDTSNVTSMSSMFRDCRELQTIDITSLDKISSVSNMGNFAFNCYSLTKVIIRTMTKVPPLNTNSFSNCYHFKGTQHATYNPQGLKDARIYVPDDYVDQLKSATNWSTYADIIVPLSTLVE